MAASGGDVEHALRTGRTTRSSPTSRCSSSTDWRGPGVAPGDAAPAGETRTAPETARAPWQRCCAGHRLPEGGSRWSPRRSAARADACWGCRAGVSRERRGAGAVAGGGLRLRACGAFAGSSPGDVVANPRGGGVAGSSVTTRCSIPPARAASPSSLRRQTLQTGGPPGVRTILRAVLGPGAGGRRRGTRGG